MREFTCRKWVKVLNSFLHFDKMITPSIIKFIFWIGSAISVLAGLVQIINGASSYYGGGYLVFMGILMIVLGPVLIRIYCELLILFFKIYETLQEIKTGSAPKQKDQDII